jgi:hypothetical protein
VARFTFTTTDPAVAERWMHADDLCHVITELDNAMRDRVKHGVDSAKFKDGVQWARDTLTEMMHDNDISTDRMWT